MKKPISKNKKAKKKEQLVVDWRYVASICKHKDKHLIGNCLISLFGTFSAYEFVFRCVSCKARLCSTGVESRISQRLNKSPIFPYGYTSVAIIPYRHAYAKYFIKEALAYPST